MKLNEVLNSLDAMGFFRNRWLIQIVVTKGKSLKKDDQLFDCLVPVREAKHFFGELDVIVNRMENVGEYKIPTFWFLLAYEEKGTHKLAVSREGINMNYNVYYILKKECLGYPVGTKIRVHDWNDKYVQISIGSSLEWITTVEFDNITRSE